MHVVFFVLAVLVVGGGARRLSHLDLTPHKHLLILYSRSPSDPHPQKLQLQISFPTKQLTLSKELFQQQPIQLYLDEKCKYRLPQTTKINHKSIHKQLKDTQDVDNIEEQVHGIVGFAAGSQMFAVLRGVLGVAHFKLWVKMYENVIQVIPEACTNPIFPPYNLQVQTGIHNIFIKIPWPSFSFSPKSPLFLNLLAKPHDPFTLSKQQLSQRLNIQLLNIVQTVPLRSILGKKCRKISGSSTNNYECQLKQNYRKGDDDDFGILLMEFQPVVCVDRDAIEFKEEGKIDSGGYYWSHLGLILVEIGMLVGFRYRNRIVKRISCFIKNRKIK